MIKAHAARRFRLAGTTYAKGAALSLPENQFDDLASCGLVERAPVAPAAPVESAPKKTPARPKKARR